MTGNPAFFAVRPIKMRSYVVEYPLTARTHLIVRANLVFARDYPHTPLQEALP